MFPCGQCINCKVNKKRSWIARAMLETALHRGAYFLTLTYSVPVGMLGGQYETFICKLHLQLFFKRLRKRFEKDSFKYFAVGEYGEKRGRAHYHVVLWCGNPTYTVRDFESVWKVGSVDIGDVQHESLNYVFGYMLEDGKVENNVYSSEGGRARYPVFRLFSNGIGAGACEHLSYKNVLNREFRVFGKSYPVGRYLRLKFLGEKSLTVYWEKHGDIPIQKSAEQQVEEYLYRELRSVPYGSEAYSALQKRIADERREREEKMVKMRQIEYYRSINQPVRRRKNETF